MHDVIKYNSLRWLSLTLLAGVLAWPGFAMAEVTVTSEELASRVEQYIQESTPLNNDEATLYVEPIKLPSVPLTLAGDELTVSVADSRSTPLTSRTIVQVTLSTTEETRHIGVPVRLEIEMPVWVSTKLIRAREPISSKNATLQRKRLDASQAYALGTGEKLENYVSRINLAPGSVLDVRKLKIKPAIYRNENIHMVLAMPSGVKISALGTALEDGVVGSRIRVSQELANRKHRVYHGEVINKNTVLVKL